MPVNGARCRACLVGVLCVFAACADAELAEKDTSADLIVTVRHGVLTAPDSVRAGWTRVHIDETDDTPHIVVAFRMPADATKSDLTAFVTALDAAPATPRPGVAIGGPEMGARGDAVLHMTPGLYVLACVRRGKNGHRHASSGESRVLHVRSVASADSAFASPPPSTHVVRMVDFAYVGPDRWAAGVQSLRIENTGQQDHQFRLVRLREGVTLQQWMTADDPNTMATPVAGMARVGSGEVAYLPVDLLPGSYVAYCLIPDATSKRPHVEMGMLRAIQVP